MIAADLEALLPALAVEAFALTTVDQAWVSESGAERTDAPTPSVEIRPVATEPVQSSAWGVASRLHVYHWTYRMQGTSADLRRAIDRATARLHNRRAPVLTGLELTTVGEAVLSAQDGAADLVSDRYATLPVTHKADVGQGDLGA